MLPKEYRTRYTTFFALSVLVHVALVIYLLDNPLFEPQETQDALTVEVKLKNELKDPGQKEKKTPKQKEWEKIKKQRKDKKKDAAKKKDEPKAKPKDSVKEKKPEPKKPEPKKPEPKKPEPKKEPKKAEKKKEPDPLAQTFSVDKPKESKKPAAEKPAPKQPAKPEKAKLNKSPKDPAKQAAKKAEKPQSQKGKPPKSPQKNAQQQKAAKKAQPKPAKKQSAPKTAQQSKQAPKKAKKQPPKTTDLAKQAEDLLKNAKKVKKVERQEANGLNPTSPEYWMQKLGSMKVLDDRAMQKTLVATKGVGKTFDERSVKGKKAVDRLNIIEKQQFDKYLRMGAERILESYTPPPKDGGKYHGEIWILLDQEGYIDEIGFKKPSGHSALDSAMYQAVANTLQLELPPDPEAAYALYIRPITLWYTEEDMK